MAGIGETSAIIAVAQIGIQASKTIFEFVGEVKDAPKEIRRIGRDICTTSERLEEIGRLIDNNHTSRFFNQGGIASAVRCSNDCKEIITQVNSLLAKGGWVFDSEALDKKDFDISLLDALRWPFLRTKLASPQADLEKVKASLSLLFNSIMATASANPMQSEYALQIPKLKKWAEQATRKAENERRRSRQAADSSGRYTQREVHWKDQQSGEDEEDPEMRQKFVEFQVRLVKEEEERRAQQRAAIIQAEKDAKRKAEDENRKRIEQSAIDQYKTEQENIKLHKSEKEQKFKDELAELGIEPEKIQSIINTTGFQELELDSVKQNVSRTRLTQAPKDNPNLVNGGSDESSVAAMKAVNESTKPSRPWFSRSRLPGQSSADVNAGNTYNTQDDHGFRSTQYLQLWLVDLVSGQNVELTPSHKWLRSKVDKARYDEIAHKMAKLKHPWRTAILDFLRSRNDREPPHLVWKLCFIGLPRRVTKFGLFGHQRSDCLVRLVLCQHKVAEYDPNNTLLWDETRLGTRDSMSLNQRAESSAKANTKNRKSSLKGALKHPSGIEGNKVQRHAKSESREVAFADSGESDDELDTIKIDIESFGDGLQRGTTTMDDSLFPSIALEELDLPWRKLDEEVDGEMRELVQLPLALSHDQIEQLKKITMTKIIEGEVAWRRPPEWKLQETLREYAGAKPRPTSPTSTPENNNVTASVNRGYSRLRPDVTAASKVNEPPERLIREPSISREYTDLDMRIPSRGGRNDSQTVETIAPKNNLIGPANRENFPRQPPEWDIMGRGDGLRENYLPREDSAVREVITHHRHIDHGYEPERLSYRTERSDDYGYERGRPISPARKDGGFTKVRRYRIPETPRYREFPDETRPTYRGSERGRERDEILVRDRERPREDYTIDRRRSSRIIIPEREEPRDVEEIYDERRALDEREEAEILELERRRIRPRGIYDEDIDILRGRGNRGREEDVIVREREHYSPDFGYSQPARRFTADTNRTFEIRPRQSPRNRELETEIIRVEKPMEWPAYREVRERGAIFRERERDFRRDEEGSTERIIIREDPYQDREYDRSKPIRRTSVVIDNDAAIRAIERRNERGNESTNGRPIVDAAQTNEDIISSTLGEFTTFNANPAEDLATSPTAGLNSPFPLDTGTPYYARNLKSAQQKLDELLEKHDKATKEGDFLFASDLQFYAIPDVKALVEELKAQEARVNPLERIQEVEDSELASESIQEDFARNKDIDRDNLQPGVRDPGSSNDSSTEYLIRRATNSHAQSEKVEINEGEVRDVSTSARDNNHEPIIQAPNGISEDREPGIVRRPTASPSVAATVQDEDAVD